MLKKFTMLEFKPVHILAQSDPHRTGSSLPTPEQTTGEIRWFDDMAIVAGAGLLLMVALMAWAKFFRNSSRRQSDNKSFLRSVPKASSLSDPLTEADRRRKKRRRKRKDHRPRNPTLEETGGLPDLKKEDHTVG